MTNAMRTLERIGTLTKAPLWQQMSADDRDQFMDRFSPPRPWADVSDGDRKIIRAGELQVSAGMSPSLVDPSEWGDHDRIDAAIDADDDDLLDAALFTVGHGYGVRLEWETGEPSSTPPASADGELKSAPELPDPDDAAWVGL